MLVRFLLAAIFAGMAAGIFATAVQSWRVVPLILEAERYEDAGDTGAGHTHSQGEASGEEASTGETAMAEAEEPWAPEDGTERTFYTALANVVVGVAYSLLLTAAVLALNQSITPASGLLWGAAGFVIFVLAPNFGLPPELPGMPAGDLTDRQIWWLVTVICTAGGLYLLAFRRALPLMLLALVLIVAPHLWGAPQPIEHESAVPANLAAEFVVSTIVASALFWLFLGGLLGYLFQRAAKQESASA
ncbi:CbtA family protein [Salaquimonas pukyongi]|uniref:CbtA family protein n=1 Tax=Salaquimonas pukyongi TaxID=2712698 RepID=UPI00096BA569|nr:CbtA family protein [Salaquimonas pukyongi]